MKAQAYRLTGYVVGSDAEATKRANHKRLSEAEHGLYLIAELASLMARTRLTEWPPDQADLFRRRLREIAKIRSLQRL